MIFQNSAQEPRNHRREAQIRNENAVFDRTNLTAILMPKWHSQIIEYFKNDFLARSVLTAGAPRARAVSN